MRIYGKINLMNIKWNKDCKREKLYLKIQNNLKIIFNAIESPNEVLFNTLKKKLSKEMGESGRKFIQKEFSLEASAKNFRDIIKPYMKKQ